MSGFLPAEVLVEADAASSPLSARLRRRVPPGVAWHELAPGELPPRPASVAEGKRRLLLTRRRGRFLTQCPGGRPGHLCCGYLVLDLVSNCPLDCSYCFLQDYLRDNPLLAVAVNVEDALGEVAAVVDRAPRRFFRIGTGELTDSLVLDPLLELSRELVPFFARRANVLLELKTKSAAVDTLLSLDPGTQVVVSWSVNPPELAAAEEKGAAPLAERIAAASRCQAAGYRLAFHFDPLIAVEGWEEAYRGLVGAIFATIDPKRVAWVSLGTLRLSPRLRQAMRERRPASRLASLEQVRGADGKWRFPQAVRVGMYRRLARWLRAAAPGVALYLCMETPAVWEKVFGSAPSCDRELAAAVWSQAEASGRRL